MSFKMPFIRIFRQLLSEFVSRTSYFRGLQEVRVEMKSSPDRALKPRPVEDSHLHLLS